MTINGVDYGHRSPPQQRKQVQAVSSGISAANDIQVIDFGRTQQDVTILFIGMSQANEATLSSYLLNTIRIGNAFSVTTDTGDDLDLGGGTPLTVSLRLLDYVSESYVGAGTLLRNVTISARRYT